MSRSSKVPGAPPKPRSVRAPKPPISHTVDDERGRTERDGELLCSARDVLRDLAVEKARGAFPCNEDGNASRFVATWGDVVRFCPDSGRGQWRVFADGRWVVDTANQVPAMARAITCAIDAELDGPDDPTQEAGALRAEIDDWAHKSQTEARRRAIVSGAAARLGQSIADFDPPTTDRLLNTDAGPVELATGMLVPPDPALLITKRAGVPYRPGATCPEFLTHLRTWMCGRDHLAEFVRLSLGAALVPGLVDRAFYIHWGPRGANGKSTFFRVILEVLGTDYAGMVGDAALTVQRNRGSHNEALGQIVGRRVIFASEADGADALDGRLIKSLTGADYVSLRRIYGEQATIRPTWTIFLGTNAIPRVVNADDATRDRLRIIPWDHRIPLESQVLGLAARLVEREGPGILNWVLKAARDAIALNGAGPVPPEVTAEVNDYCETSDPAAGWWASGRVEFDQARVRDRWTSQSALYQNYVCYCADEGAEPARPEALGQFLNSKGVPRDKRGGVRVRRGIILVRLDVADLLSA